MDRGAKASEEVPELGETLEFDEIYRRYAPYAATVALRVMGRRSEVEDLVQEVFVDVHQGLSKLQNPAALRSWIATITVRKATRRLKWLSARRFIGLPVPEVDPDVVDASASPEDRALVQQVFRALERVDADARVAWLLRNLEGLKLEEVAEQCGCALATAKRRIAKAQAILQKEFPDG